MKRTRSYDTRPQHSLLPGILDDIVRCEILPRLPGWTKCNLRTVSKGMRVAIQDYECVSYANVFVRNYKGIRPPTVTANCKKLVQYALQKYRNVPCPPKYALVWLSDYPYNCINYIVEQWGGTSEWQADKVGGIYPPVYCSVCEEPLEERILHEGYYLVDFIPVGKCAGECHSSCVDRAIGNVARELSTAILHAYRERMEMHHPGFDVAEADAASCYNLDAFLNLFEFTDFDTFKDFWDLNKPY